LRRRALALRRGLLLLLPLLVRVPASSRHPCCRFLVAALSRRGRRDWRQVWSHEAAAALLPVLLRRAGVLRVWRWWRGRGSSCRVLGPARSR
jgi:hypothetical protein